MARGPSTAAAIPRAPLGGPPRRIAPLSVVHVLLGDFRCWFGAVFSFPLPFAPLAARDDDWAALGVLIFPAIGITLFAFGVKKGRRGLELLRHGREATGTFVDAHPTGTEINDIPVMRMRYRFVDASGGERFAIAQTHETAPLRDQRDEPLLYEPARGGDAMLLDDLPGLPRVAPAADGDVIVVHDHGTAGRAWLAVVVSSGVVLSALATTVAAIAR